MDLFGSNFVDAGAGNGAIMACAIAAGAAKATGYELPENVACLMSRLEQTMIPPGYSVGRGNLGILMRYYCIRCAKFLPFSSKCPICQPF